jgi:HK97 family phage major capsid protein
VNPIAGGGETRGGIPENVDRRAARLADLQGIGIQDAETRAQRFATSGIMEITTDAVYRSITLSGGNIAQPTRVSGINPGQNIVSGIVDMVRVVNADGMGEDSVAYEVSGSQTAAVKKDDGTAPTPTDPNLKIAKITPVMITTLAYVSKNIQRTTPLNYQDRVSEGALTALRKKTGALIVTGNPSATIPEPTGILKAAAIADGSDITVEKIDEKTLRKIALSYGGANNVEGGGVLLLNKDDLIAFGDIRGTNEKKAVYEIEFSENSTTTGTIKDGGLAVKFCIVDELPALSDTKTAAGSYCMAYGKPLAYQLDLFGPYTVEVSRDYKFAEGLLAVMGTAMIGGNVITENGFLRVKSKATA